MTVTTKVFNFVNLFNSVGDNFVKETIVTDEGRDNIDDNDKNLWFSGYGELDLWSQSSKITTPLIVTVAFSDNCSKNWEHFKSLGSKSRILSIEPSVEMIEEQLNISPVISLAISVSGRSLEDL